MPRFGCFAWNKPDPIKVARAGFQWFESGYPGTLSASDNQYLLDHGVGIPIAYINMSQVPDQDTSLQNQIGLWYRDIRLCTAYFGDHTLTVVDVRDPRWQNWLITRANYAWDLGNRGIKWDIAEVENACGGSLSATAKQQALDAMAGVLTQLRTAHPGFKFIVNQGFGLAEQYSSLVDGFELENHINYYEQTHHDQWATDVITRVSAIHNRGIAILDLEYVDLFASSYGCGYSDTSCAYATQLYNEIVGLNWVPYITVVDMNIEGRGLNITPPW